VKVRFQLPVRIPLSAVLGYAVAVFCAQQFQHTSVAFSLLYFCEVVLTAVAFNAAEGFSTPAGAYACFLYLFTCGLGVTAKIFFNEAADSNLLTPTVDMAAYVGVMLMLLLVIVALKKLNLCRYAFATSYFANYGAIDYDLTAAGFLVAGAISSALNLLAIARPGSALSALNFLNVFFPLGIIFGTITAIRKSGGRRAVNLVSGICIVQVFLEGFLGFSKQGMMTPVVCWLVAAMYCRLKIKKTHVIVLAANAFLAIFFITIWSGARQAVPEGGLDLYGRTQLVVFELQHFSELKQTGLDLAAQNVNLGQSGYFNAEYGILDRLSMIFIDDGLIDYSEQGHYDGYFPVIADFENWVPHFIAPNKPVPPSGNYYYHEMGVISEENTTTGISFSPAAEAFHLGHWTGIFLLFPAIMLLLFATVDLTVGDLRYTPWGLFLIVVFAHVAPEGGVASPVYFVFYGNIVMAVAIFFGARVAPVIGAVIYGDKGKRGSAGRLSPAASATR
jgi:hypothetical protein